MSGQNVGAYTYVDDLWIITSFFNPQGYKTKLRNYELFLEKIERSGLNCVVVECAFGNTPFSLRRSLKVLQIRGKDIMWQKERLLNLAIQRLPDICRRWPGWIATSCLIRRLGHSDLGAARSSTCRPAFR